MMRKPQQGCKVMSVTTLPHCTTTRKPPAGVQGNVGNDIAGLHNIDADNVKVHGKSISNCNVITQIAGGVQGGGSERHCRIAQQ
jgi:hypothetical protein